MTKHFLLRDPPPNHARPFLWTNIHHHPAQKSSISSSSLFFFLLQGFMNPKNPPLFLFSCVYSSLDPIQVTKASREKRSMPFL